MWTRLTTDNEEFLYDLADKRVPVMISYTIDDSSKDVYYNLLADMSPTIHTMAKSGRYWYYVIPENLQALQSPSEFVYDKLYTSPSKRQSTGKFSNVEYK